MKKILLAVVAANLVLSHPAKAQDAAVDERLNKLSGYIEDLQKRQDAEQNQLDSLSKELDGLRDQLNKPSNSVSQDELQKLADQLQDIDKKREADKQLILQQIAALGSAGGDVKHARKPVVKPEEPPSTPTANPGASGTEKGFEYQIQSGDTISAIAAAYHDKGIKVTADQILKANPGLKANSLRVGQKIFIPAPAQ